MESYSGLITSYFIIKFFIDVIFTFTAIYCILKFAYNNRVQFARYMQSLTRGNQKAFVCRKSMPLNFLKKVDLSGIQLTPEEKFLSSFLVHPDAVRTEWGDMIGRGAIVDDIFATIVLPVNSKQPFAGSSLHREPRGILLYGPSGCGKSLMGRAIATAVGGRFLNIQTHTLMYSQYGTIALVNAIFSLALKLSPCIIYIENIDNFLLRRRRRNVEALGPYRDIFIQCWKEAVVNNQILVIGTAVAAAALEEDVLSLMDVRYRFGLPEETHREALLLEFLRKIEPGNRIDLHALISETNEMTIRQLKDMCITAVRMTIDMNTGQRRSLKQEDLISAKNRILLRWS